jgi:5-methyltetrahydropteroyltriglutamate--homocysteine methyltransferase
MDVAAYQFGIYPRSETVVAATRALERGRADEDEVEAAYRADRDAFVAVQRQAGLDYFSDGLLRWQDLFRPLVHLSGGMDAHTLVRWFDNNTFFRSPEVTGDLTLEGALPAVLLDHDAVPEPRVATLPSPYLFSRAAQTTDDQNALMMDLTREVLRPVAEALVTRGYRVLHLLEPWLPYHGIDTPDWADFEKAMLELREATRGAALVLHASFGDAGPHVDRLRNLPVDAIGVDFVDTDLGELGRRWTVGCAAGVIDGRRSPIEDTEGAASLVQRIAETLEPPTLYVTSSCELEFLPTDVAREKVLRLGAVTRLVKERIG